MFGADRASFTPPFTQSSNNTNHFEKNTVETNLNNNVTGEGLMANQYIRERN